MKVINIENVLVILSPGPEALSDNEEINDSSSRKIGETMSDEVCPKEVAAMIGNLLSNSVKNMM